MTNHMDKPNFWGLQTLVFALVAAAFTTVYITQPVLPILQREFGVSASIASLSVSAVILGIALAIFITLIKSMPAIAAALALVCAGFFAMHAAAAGSLNRKLTTSRGRANSLYVLYITWAGPAASP
jgi:YNFM family putative membrane transporter